MSTEQHGGHSRTGSRTDAPAAAPRTLADELRARSDDGLAGLLRVRPDLLSPVPNDLTQLATRAGTRASVVRAAERLDRFALQTAEALAVAPEPCPYGTLAALLTGDEGNAGVDAGVAAEVTERLPRALSVLRAQALLWGGDDRLRLVRTARELLAPSPSSPSPTGLGPTLSEAVSGMSPGRLQEILTAAGLPGTHDPVSALESLTALFTDRRRMAELLSQAPAESAAVLGKLEWGPPYGSVDANSPSPPVAWLLDRALLVASGPRTVVLPREVALHLRGGRAHRAVEPAPPAVAVQREHPVTTVDATAAGQAFTALGTVEELLSGWEEDPPGVLRAGGLGVRELKRTAEALDVPEPTAAFWVELAYRAGLLASDGAVDECYAPTPAYDDWLHLPAQERWAQLATAWLTGTRVAGLVGERDGRGRTLTALGPGLDRGPAPEFRRRVLELLAGLEEGAAPERDSLLERLAWERPLRGAAVSQGPSGQGVPSQGTPSQGFPSPGPPSQGAPSQGSAAESPPAPPSDLRSRIAEWTLHEAELLGFTGRGALASYARRFVPETPAESAELTSAELAAAARQAATELAPLLPEPLDHVLLQADLTAVAPGPLRRPLAEDLGALADIESKGGATVYRFTPDSVRRGLDAGRSAADIHTFLATHSQTPVPQPLSYLVDDVARKHGRLRVGAASSYVRCDDDALLAEIMADKRSAPLRPRLLAPTVLASPAPPGQLLATLREMGYAPAAETAEGDVVIARADVHRTPPRTAPEPVPDGPPPPDEPLLTAAVRAIRAGDHAATSAPKQPKVGARTPDGELPRTTSADTLATMQTAALTGSAVWMGYVNADGAASQHVIAPVRVEGGFVTGYDHTADEVRTYPLHRITGVAELDDS